MGKKKVAENAAVQSARRSRCRVYRVGGLFLWRQRAIASSRDGAGHPHMGEGGTRGALSASVLSSMSLISLLAGKEGTGEMSWTETGIGESGGIGTGGGISLSETGIVESGGIGTRAVFAEEILGAAGGIAFFVELLVILAKIFIISCYFSLRARSSSSQRACTSSMRVRSS